MHGPFHFMGRAFFLLNTDSVRNRQNDHLFKDCDGKKLMSYGEN